MNVLEAPSSDLTHEQWELVVALVRSLNQAQLLWVSEYLAGRVQTPVSGTAPSRRLTILFGSETGNGAEIAASAADSARSIGLHPTVRDLADYKLRLLMEEEDLLFITSTHGEGDPPHTAEPFFEFLEGRKAPQLSGKRFAVVALGDSTYEKFCEAGRRLDRRLEELGASRLAARVDCDVDYEKNAAAAISQILAKLGPCSPGAGEPPLLPRLEAVVPSRTIFDKRHPFPAPVVDNVALTGRGSSKETRHIELSIAGSGMTFEPGDALGVAPANNPHLVESLLASAGFSPDAGVLIDGQPVRLHEALTSKLEIVRVTRRLLRFWADQSGISELGALCEEGQAELRAALLKESHVIDLLRRFPLRDLSAQSLVDNLRPLQPRLYSIASSAAFAPGEVHLTVAVVRYPLHGEPRHGVASAFLADAAPETSVPVFVQSNPHFRLPANDVPIVMIGAGTGIAPFRAFLQEREMRGASGKNWLFFGERHFRTDFLYQTEWQAHLHSGLLTRMNVAFSREGTTKTYAQHRLLEQARDLYAWLQDGCHIYVCGDAVGLTPGVHAALRCVLQQEGGLDLHAAEEHLTSLRSSRRYQIDAY